MSSDPFSIRPLPAHEWPAYRAARLRALADAPDAFCQTLAEAQARTDAQWTARFDQAQQSGRDLPLVAEQDGAVIGMAWAIQADDATVEVFQVWVAPDWRGRGVAAALLQAVIDWAMARGAPAITLSVTCGAPAARLYARLGFCNVGAPTPRAPGAALLEQAMRLDLPAAKLFQS